MQVNVERDRLLLDLMLHVYDEEEHRNELIDSKNSQMIIFIGAVLTLQATLFTNLLVQYIMINPSIILSVKVVTTILMFITIVLIHISSKDIEKNITNLKIIIWILRFFI